MTRLWTAGAELQTATAAIEFSAIVTNAPGVNTSIKRSGNAAWQINNISAIEGFRQIHTASQGSFYFRFYLYVVAMPVSTRIIGGARTTVNKIVFRLTSAGKLQLYNAEDSAQVGSDSATTLSTATWYRIEMMYDSTTLASTTCEGKIDGTSFASGTVDLAATPTSFGCFIDAGDALLDYIVDDLAVNDTTGSFQTGYPGEGEVIILRPNGNGDNSAWTGSDGNSTDNYLLVDEVPPDTADYVESNTAGQIDEYALEDTPAAMDSNDVISVVQVGVYAAVSDATGGDPDVILRIRDGTGGIIEESATLDVNSITFQGPAPLPANSNYQLTLYDLPSGSTSAWTKAKLDTVQIGVRESVTDTHFVRVAAAWLTVDHKPGAGGTTYNDSVSVSRRETVSDRMTDNIFPSVLISQRDSVLDGMTNNISPLILLSQRDGVSEGMNNSIPKNSSLNTVLSIIDAAGVGIYPSLTLGQRVAFVPANIALVGGSVSIGQALGLIDVPRLDAQASLAFLKRLGINLSSALSTNQVEAVLALAEHLGLNASAQLRSFPLVGIGERLFLVEANNANMLGSNVLSEIRAFNVSGGLSFQSSLTIGIDLEFLTSKLVSIFKSVQVSEALGISESVRANMQAAVSLGERSGMGSLVNQLLNAGLSINVVGSILTISGTDVMIVKGFVFTSDSAKNSLSVSDFSKGSIETGDS